MNVDSYYESKGAAYRKMSFGRKRHILDLIPSGTGEVLDIGCATGKLATNLQQRGFRVSGVDISAQALAAARPYLEEVYQFDVSDTTWPAGLWERRFDVIIASEIIEHLFDPVSFLKKIRHLLKPGARVLITTPNFLFWKNRLKMLAGTFQYAEQGLLDFGHIRFFTLATAREAIRSVGFYIEREHHYYPNLEHRGFPWLGKLAPGLFAYQLIFQLTLHE